MTTSPEVISRVPVPAVRSGGRQRPLGWLVPYFDFDQSLPDDFDL